jgi:hypothetical protein
MYQVHLDTEKGIETTMLILLFYFLERALFSTRDNRTVAKLEELWSEDMMSDIVPNNTVCNRKHQNWLLCLSNS